MRVAICRAATDVTEQSTPAPIMRPAHRHAPCAPGKVKLNVSTISVQ